MSVRNSNDVVSICNYVNYGLNGIDGSVFLEYLNAHSNLIISSLSCQIGLGFSAISEILQPYLHGADDIKVEIERGFE